LAFLQPLVPQPSFLQPSFLQPLVLPSFVLRQKQKALVQQQLVPSFSNKNI